MRNLFFALLTIFMVSTSAVAETTSTQNAIVNSADKVKITLDLGDITNATEAETNNKIDKFLVNTLSSMDEALDCEVTVTATINIGVASFDVSVTISGTCEEVMASANQIANQIINDIKNHFTKNYK